MFIKNLTSTNLTINTRGNGIILEANNTTLIPDGLVTFDELLRLFGPNTIVEVAEGPETTMMTNQQTAEVSKLYLANPSYGARVFIGLDGTVDVYGSDSATIPTTFAEMDCPEANEGVTGILMLGITPRYLAFKSNTGTPEIILTNCNLYEVQDLS